MTNREQNKLSKDMAVIVNEMKNMNNNFKEFKNDTKELVKKVNGVENKQIAIEARTSNLAIFQGVFSVIIGAIASYLGVKR